MTNRYWRIIRDEDGQDIIEYGLLASFISIVAVLALKAIVPLVQALYNAILAALIP